MKLANRYFRTNLVATISIFLLAGITFYFLLGFVMLNQVDDDLKIEQRETENYIAKYDRPPEAETVKDLRSSFEPTDLKVNMRSFQTIKSPDVNETEDFRQIRFTEKIGDKWYLFKVSKSLEGMEKMNHSIIIVSFITIVLILLVTLLINRWIFRRLWQPFYETLKSVSHFKLGEKKYPVFGQTKIDEFTLLNSTLDHFIVDADREYTSLKEFTENASHELQTPLAIIRSKLDVLIQDENLTEIQGNAAASAYEALKRMVKLNHSLLLLTKIENKQFEGSSSFDIKTLIDKKLEAYHELFLNKNIRVVSSLSPTNVNANIELVDILLNNLFSNAFRHSDEGRPVQVTLRHNELMISNESDIGALNPDHLFKRFSKAGQSGDHHGLGLSIIQQICTALGWKVSYRYENSLHCFLVSF